MMADGFTPARPTMFAVAVTAMDKDGKIDEAGCRAHLRRMIDAGIGIYLGGGGTPQGFALDPDEWLQIVQIGVNECKGKVPVYGMPPESHTSKDMLRKCNLAIKAGVDIVQLYQLDAGHGMLPPVSDQERYFRDLLDQITHPVVLSFHSNAGYLAPVALTIKLCNEYPQVKAVNLSGTGLLYFVQLKDGIRPDIKIYGGINMFLSMLPMGGWGCQAATPNVIPNLCRSIIDHFLAGDMKKMGEAYANMLKIWDCLKPAWAESLDTTKEVLRGLGFPVGYPRLPRTGVSQATLDKVVKDMETLHFWEIEGVSKPKK
jgi:4-hydroxy-tetrahydrodipicolinate synthase